MGSEVKVVSLLLVLCGTQLSQGSWFSGSQPDHPSSDLLLKKSPADDSNALGIEVLLSKLQFLENEFRKMSDQMENRIDLMNKQTTENLLQLETTIKQRFDSFEAEHKKHIEQPSGEVSKPHPDVSSILTEIKDDLSHLKSLVEPLSSVSAIAKANQDLKLCRDTASEQSGTVMVQMFTDESTTEVYCEQEKFDGGWLVFQRRFNGSVDFYRTWTDYRYGFGDVGGEFWFGLEKLHQLTKNRRFELIVELEADDGSYQFARYDDFAIGSEEDMYSLKRLGGFSGNATDSLSNQRYRRFETKDRHNDACYYNYAEEYLGAWWYYLCDETHSDLNRPYEKTKEHSIYWFGISFAKRIVATTMMIREFRQS